MTDFQLKAILAMVYSMLDKCKTFDDYVEMKKTIAALSRGIVPPLPEDDSE
jgi:hypothetical protein